ncbi:enoyl-CoA hydratase/isomerase family protein [Cryobacterium sp. TMS1-20-1]|uniref:enoyl-CoA hydratase/isomerase family protein n=1 Tax=Cryobacterium sp. TMS1-20-1 TaxID=1259223 RepID=UPI00106D72B7|nr:enoyl-CoA hydratase-related protein [Cryobacterium sp. TMS1-20-1]TFC70960.1 enoyl-CoA hydratase/isomerase family protein [Cryobacterium sp. TMS1-20-1]
MTTLEIDKRGDGVAVLKLNGPETLNALDEGIKKDLLAALTDIDSDDDVRVVLLTGVGRAFCAGGDVRQMAAVPAVETVARVTLGNQVIEKIVSLQKVVVAGVNGLASGAGFNLALAADIVLADRSAWFQQSFMQIGLAPDMGGTYLLTQQLGWQRAKVALLTGHRFTVEEGHALGFVAEIVDGDFFDEALRYCEVLARRPPLALSATKTLVNNAAAAMLSTALRSEATTQAVLSITKDHRRAVDAFQTKQDLRSVEFQGD